MSDNNGKTEDKGTEDAAQQSGRAKVNRLNHGQFYKLCVWVSSNAEQLMKDRPMYKVAAEQATKELGFMVSPTSSLLEAMRETNVTWETPVKGGMGSRKRLEGDFQRAREETARHKERIIKLEADMAWMRALVHQLYHKLGEKPPAGYQLPPMGRCEIISHPAQTVSHKPSM
jgi:hypothetical protein